ALQAHNIGGVLNEVQPASEAYQQLKGALKKFKTKYSTLTWDTLPLNVTDTLAFRSRLRQRLIQTGHMDTLSRDQDTIQLQAGVKAFQEEFNMYADGKAGKKTIQALNRPFTDWMEQVAVNLDRWRKLPDTLPSRYIFVNLPGFWMHVVEDGQVTLASRVIVGAPGTRSPLLTSTLTNFQLYPYWRVPFSITVKEMIPAIKRNINYLAQKNLQVIDKDGQEVDPTTIDWSRMGQHYFPYTLRQMDGEDNSLGVMKFNFFNKYSVYMHDTNSRGLFKNAFRALSHGCVRVQQWDSLANYLVGADSSHPYLRDSIKVWLARGERKQVDLRNRIPVYFRYFTAEAAPDGKLRFNEDIYGEDKIARRWLERE
ncbi:MAG TPA: L,D-transpeptidase family protein, partial [Chitinophaga sp.]